MLLSICIPTFNRRRFLRENLSAILSQLNLHKQEVEVLVNDNASTEDVAPMVKELVKDYGANIDYNKNSYKVKADENFDIVVSRAKGDYIYLMGDDDIVSPNFFDVIIPLLRQKKYAILHWGRLVGDAHCSNNRIHDPEFTGTIMEMSFGDFVKRVMSAPNFMSSLIFDRLCWEKGKEKVKDNYYGYQWFARVYFGALALHKPCLYYYFPLVLMRNPNRDWSKLGTQYFILGLGNIFHDLDKQVPGLYQEWIKRVHDHRFYDVLGTLGGVLLDRPFYRKIKNELNVHLTAKERYLLYAYLYLPFPKVLRKIVYISAKVSRKVFKKR